MRLQKLQCENPSFSTYDVGMANARLVSHMRLYARFQVFFLRSPPDTAKQQHRLVSFSPEQTNANGRYS